MDFQKAINKISYFFIRLDSTSHTLTLALSQELFCHESVLPVPQDESQEGEDERIQDAHNSQDVGPAHGAGPQAVFVSLLAAHLPNLVAVPAIRIDHTTQYQTDTWWEVERGRISERRKQKTKEVAT